MQEYYNLVYSIALKYQNNFVEFEDLLQEGFIGLYKAYKTYNSKKNVMFSTYAYFWIKKQIIEFIKQQKKNTFLGLEEANIENISYNEEISIEDLDEINFEVNNLSDLEYKILELNFKQKIPLDEIAKILNLSREKVRQIKTKALRKLKVNTKLTKSL